MSMIFDPELQLPLCGRREGEGIGEEERMLPRILLISSSMGPVDEMIVPGDLECSCNMVSFIWSVQWKTSRSICDI